MTIEKEEMILWGGDQRLQEKKKQRGKKNEKNQ
jgi:hypothetical protein